MRWSGGATALIALAWGYLATLPVGASGPLFPFPEWGVRPRLQFGAPLARVVLLTSLDAPRDLPPAFKAWGMRFESKLGALWAQGLDVRGADRGRAVEWPSESSAGTGAADMPYELVAYHKVTADVLARELANPRNIAVVYLAHAGGSSLGGSGINTLTLTDYLRNSVLPVLAAVHPGLRYLGIVGCTTQAIVDHLRQLGLLSPELVAEGFGGLVDARAALQQSIRGVRRHAVGPLWQQVLEKKIQEPLCLQRKGVRVQLTRTFAEADPTSQMTPTVHDALMVTRADGRVVAVFPPAGSGAREQKLEAWLDLSVAPTRAAQLKLVAGTGASPLGDRAGLELGRLTVQAPALKGEWRVFADSSGKPIGVTENVYRYGGELPVDWTTVAQDYAPFACE